LIQTAQKHAIDARLIDFTYPEETVPAGVIERGTNAATIAVIDEVAGQVRYSLDSRPGHVMDCRYACAAWARALRSRGIVVELDGGEGIDDEVFVDYQLVPVDRRSGYREADGLVHRHYWLVLGKELRLFDPTAHQFDSRGGVSRERYTTGADRTRTRSANSEP
jgi:hypothetical protein